jgi:hypothetical protein
MSNLEPLAEETPAIAPQSLPDVGQLGPTVPHREEREARDGVLQEPATRRSWRIMHGLFVVPQKRTLIAWSPAVVPLVILPLIILLARLELNEPLFGDTYAFQYTGWCIRHGLRLYQDIGMADGPFIHFFHAVVQIISGTSETAFRRADLVVQAMGGATLGLLLTPKTDLSRSARIVQGAIWAALGATVWLSWNLSLDWTTTTERETYYGLFGSVGMTLLYVSAAWQNQRLAAAGIFLGALLVSTQVFGKPTGLAYVGLGALGVALANWTSPERRRMRVRMFVAGAIACGVIVLLALVFWGSIRGYFFWCIKMTWRGNRFLFGVSWTKLLFSQWDNMRRIALSSFIVGVATIAAGLLPRRALVFALAPPIFWVGACLQARGYNYQTVPVYAASYTLLLMILSALWQESSRPRWASRRALFAVITLGFVAQTCIDNYHLSPYRWSGESAQWTRRPREFAPTEQEVGLYVKDHTKPEDRVFAYSVGENAHVLLYFARRRTASPFLHSFWLDPIGLLPQSQVKPNEVELAKLEELQKEIRDIACTAVEKNPPAAMAFNVLPQVFKVCPQVEKMIQTLYDDATTIGDFHVYLRKAPRS